MYIAAWVRARGYAPHRHNMYTFAMTLEGVKCFSYRGAGAIRVGWRGGGAPRRVA